MSEDSALAAFGEWERASWEERATSYAASLGDLTRGSIPAVLDVAEVAAGTRVLDAGTGPGFVALAAAARGAVVQAVDQSAEMVRIAGAAGVDARRSGVESLPFEDGRFEVVLAAYLVNHLPRPDRAVSELGRVLTGGGRLAMTLWDVPAHNPALGLLGSVCAERGLTADVPVGPDPYRFAAEGEAHRLLAGWEQVTVQRPRWLVEVEPGAWFDAVADSTPRSGAALAQAGPAARRAAREAYVALALARYDSGQGRVALPAGAVLISGRTPA